MEKLGISGIFLAVQILNFLLVVGVLALMVGALLALRGYPLTAAQQFIWVSLILFVPLLGPAAFWVVGPPSQARASQ